jgi:hypothetical protein
VYQAAPDIYYKVNGKVFYDRWEFDSDPTLKKQAKFCYHDQTWRQLDWNRPTDLSLDQLYALRAHEIRDQYDYVVVCYSGGADSANIISTFVRHEIPIDEIVNWNSMESTGMVQGTVNNQEFTCNATPMLELLLRESKHRPKISIYDETKLYQTWFQDLRKNFYPEYLRYWGGLFCLFITGAIFKYLNLPRDKKIAIVTGADSPNLIYKDSRWHFYHWDMWQASGTWGTYCDPDLEFFTWEHFYRAPSAAPMIIKQLHAMRDFMCHHTESVYYYGDNDQGPRKRSPVRDKSDRVLKPKIFQQIIYPNLIQDVVVVQKPKNMVIRNEDCWWIKDLPSPDKKIWFHKAKETLHEHLSPHALTQHIVPVQKNIILTDPYCLD